MAEEELMSLLARLDWQGVEDLLRCASAEDIPLLLDTLLSSITTASEVPAAEQCLSIVQLFQNLWLDQSTSMSSELLICLRTILADSSTCLHSGSGISGAFAVAGILKALSFDLSENASEYQVQALQLTAEILNHCQDGTTFTSAPFAQAVAFATAHAHSELQQLCISLPQFEQLQLNVLRLQLHIYFFTCFQPDILKSQQDDIVPSHLQSSMFRQAPALISSIVTLLSGTAYLDLQHNVTAMEMLHSHTCTIYNHWNDLFRLTSPQHLRALLPFCQALFLGNFSLLKALVQTSPQTDTRLKAEAIDCLAMLEFAKSQTAEYSAFLAKLVPECAQQDSVVDAVLTYLPTVETLEESLYSSKNSLSVTLMSYNAVLLRLHFYLAVLSYPQFYSKLSADYVGCELMPAVFLALQFGNRSVAHRADAWFALYFQHTTHPQRAEWVEDYVPVAIKLYPATLTFDRLAETLAIVLKCIPIDSTENVAHIMLVLQELRVRCEELVDPIAKPPTALPTPESQLLQLFFQCGQHVPLQVFSWYLKEVERVLLRCRSVDMKEFVAGLFYQTAIAKYDHQRAVLATTWYIDGWSAKQEPPMLQSRL
eukprot:GILK01009492.1.p1 GENE.GILK01009492.1~~GILK01009492.1.p1  ORF type:complete len:605 (-),score=76.68 GILK01009492.1:390-2177(-)